MHTPARHSDPITSNMAAAQAATFTYDHQCLILACLRVCGPMGKDGIAAKAKLSGVAVARRLPELHKAGLAAPTGKHVTSLSGRAEREWKAA